MNRDKEKQAQRDKDAEDIRLGRKTREQLRQENSIFANVKNVIIHFGKHKRPK